MPPKLWGLGRQEGTAGSQCSVGAPWALGPVARQVCSLGAPLLQTAGPMAVPATPARDRPRSGHRPELSPLPGPPAGPLCRRQGRGRGQPRDPHCSSTAVALGGLCLPPGQRLAPPGGRPGWRACPLPGAAWGRPLCEVRGQGQHRCLMCPRGTPSPKLCTEAPSTLSQASTISAPLMMQKTNKSHKKMYTTKTDKDVNRQA